MNRVTLTISADTGPFLTLKDPGAVINTVRGGTTVNLWLDRETLDVIDANRASIDAALAAREQKQEKEDRP